MPHAIVIHCIAKESVESSAIHGGQLQGAFLDLIRISDATLSAELHQGNALRNYAIGVIRPRLHVEARRDPPKRFQETALRVACLDDRIYPAIARWAMNVGGAAAIFKLGDVEFQVTRVLVTGQSGEPWAAYTTFDQLVHQASDRETFIHLQFATPTCFKQGERDEPVPVPHHVFGAMARRWNAAFADKMPIPIEAPTARKTTEDFLDLIKEHVVLNHPFEVRSGVIDVGGGHKVTGFVGHATYRIIGRPTAAFVYLINLLADAAFFMGLGRKTSYGCGMVRRIIERR